MGLHRVASCCLAAVLLASGCVGRVADEGPPPVEFVGLADAVLPPDGSVEDEGGDYGEGLLPEVSDEREQPDIKEFVPDLPPVPCQVDDDCGPTGGEPCYEAVCEFDSEDDLWGTCRSVKALICVNSDPGC